MKNAASTESADLGQSSHETTTSNIANSSKSGNKQKPKQNIFTIESPEVAQWDTFQSTVPTDILQRIPAEIWSMILCNVPPTRLARLMSVSKAWSTMIERLPLWKDIIGQCKLANLKTNSSTSVMKHVLGHMVLICDLCLERSNRLGSDLPLPVRRNDILGLTWMCKQCRESYSHTHPEIMGLPDRAPKNNEVYEQGPCEKVVRRSRYRCRGYIRHDGWGRGYNRRDDFDDFDDFDEFDEDEDDDEFEDEFDESDYDDDYDYFRPVWKNEADGSSWLNQVLRRGRSRLLKTMLEMYKLKVRSDSRLCSDFIDGTKYDPDKIVAVMREMAWFFGSTEYSSYTKSGVETAKAIAVARWSREFYNDHEEQSIELFRTLENAPPESLWDKIVFALKRHQEIDEEKVRERQEREVKRQAKIEAQKQKELERENNKAQKEATENSTKASKKDSEEDENGEDDQDEDEYQDEYDSEEEEEDSDSDSDSDGYSTRITVRSDLMKKFSFSVDCNIKPPCDAIS
ncbi:hypothetical protein BGX27_003380 [Mortierella sp. AM989]|nr:hypothetical protein BGX27_003380 [Mortierella sp. AM989]